MYIRNIARCNIIRSYIPCNHQRGVLSPCHSLEISQFAYDIVQGLQYVATTAWGPTFYCQLSIHPPTADWEISMAAAAASIADAIEEVLDKIQESIKCSSTCD